MKIKIMIMSIMSFFALNAQDNPKDKLIETKTRIINVMEDGKMIQKKIKIKTIEKQEVKTDPNYKGEIDAPRVFPAKKIEKVIYIDNDNDPFYEKKSKIAYFKKGNNLYNFRITNSGFKIKNAKTNKIEGRARFSNNSNVYLTNLKGNNGIGYFDDGEFVVEFYDDNDVLIIERFNKK